MVGVRSRDEEGVKERKGDGKRDELEGKMNSRWQSDNPVRSIGISAGRLALHTRAAYIETRLYIERNGHVRRSPGRRGAARRGTRECTRLYICMGTST